MKKILYRFIIPIVIILAALYVSNLVIKSKPKVKRRKPPKLIQTVEVRPLRKQVYQINIMAHGIVAPRTESTLIPEVSGRIIKVSPKFRDGTFFEDGDLLLEIDSRNYLTALVVAKTDLVKKESAKEEQRVKIENYEATLLMAEAQLAKTKLKLREEEARSRLALKNWNKLRRKGKPSDLVLRKPQLISANMELKAAEAQLKKQKREMKLGDSLLRAADATVTSALAILKQKKSDLDRTKITAPYAGRIKKKYVDIGQYVSTGSVLAEIYAIDYVEVRLPLSDNQMEFIDLPENYRGDTGKKIKGNKVKIKLKKGRKEFIWHGNVVRTEGSIDIKSQQLFVVAQINDPYGRKDKHKKPLKIGQFVEAEIKGKVLQNVFLIPSSTLRAGNKVLIVDDSNMLSIRDVHVVWTEKDGAVINSGISEGERLCLTPVKYVVKNKSIKVKISKNPSGLSIYKEENKKKGDG